MYPLRLSILSLALAASANGIELAERDLDECTSAANALVEGMSAQPTADKTLASFIAKQTQWEDVADSCVIPAVTGSLAAAYTSYAKSVETWMSEFQADLSNVIDACKDIPEVQSELSSLDVPMTGLCKSYVWASPTMTGTGPATDSRTGSSTNTATSTSTPESVADNAGTRKTGQSIVALVAIACLAIAEFY